jgi:hypothetical protein
MSASMLGTLGILDSGIMEYAVEGVSEVSAWNEPLCSTYTSLRYRRRSSVRF